VTAGRSAAGLSSAILAIRASSGQLPRDDGVAVAVAQEEEEQVREGLPPDARANGSADEVDASHTQSMSALLSRLQDVVDITPRARASLAAIPKAPEERDCRSLSAAPGVDGYLRSPPHPSPSQLQQQAGAVSTQLVRADQASTQMIVARAGSRVFAGPVIPTASSRGASALHCHTFTSSSRPAYSAGQRPHSRVTVLGAGLCAGPAVELLSRDGLSSVRVVAARPGEASELCNALGRPNCQPLEVDLHLSAVDTRTSNAALDVLVEESDAVLSLLPAPLHPTVASSCIARKVPLVTASYACERMRALAGEAEAAGVPILCEMGLDPGIDHMSAASLIHAVRARGGKVTGFASVCGGLPAVDVAADTPLGYKFSWSPLGVLTALEQPAAYRCPSGEHVQVAGGLHLLKSATRYGGAAGRDKARRWAENRSEGMENAGPWGGPLGDLFNLEVLPNRNSLAYEHLYGITGASPLFRGTLRFDKWASALAGMKAMGLLDTSPSLATLMKGSLSDAGAGWPDLLRALGVEDMQAAEALAGVDGHRAYEALRAIGATRQDELVPILAADGSTSPRDALCALLSRKLAYGPGEQDLVLMEHTVDAEYPAPSFSGEGGGVSNERLVSTLVVHGDKCPGDTAPVAFSAMARTVGLTAALGTRLLLGTATGSGHAAICGGVHIPTQPAVFEAILPQLEMEGIRFSEQRAC